ncbi:MAG: phosphatase PAP2 family protein [Telmatospirillum sp.]|nr:phosphatase PAP2 family protein [Telmatospirillum sp.]
MKRLACLAGAAVAAGLVAGAAAAVAKEKLPGYLPAEAVDILSILTPAPVKGEVRYEADRKIFQSTRPFAGSPRWGLATNDVKLSTADMLRDFSCAVGVSLTEDKLPHLVHLVERANTDTSRAAGVAKDHFKRLRPYQIDQGQTCQDPAELAGSYDYPSGHTTRGWTWASLLAELAPDRSGAILARGRSFGESRIVCGVHNSSAVEAGRVTAAAVLAVVHAAPEFAPEFRAARDELALLRAAADTTRPSGCAEEAALVGQPVFLPVE